MQSPGVCNLYYFWLIPFVISNLHYLLLMPGPVYDEFVSQGSIFAEACLDNRLFDEIDTLRPVRCRCLYHQGVNPNAGPCNSGSGKLSLIMHVLT